MKGTSAQFFRLLLRCLIASVVFSLALAGLLFTGYVTKVVSALLYPAFRVADFLFGARVETHETGLNNLVAMLPFAFACNILIYTFVFCLVFKVADLLRSRSRRAAG